MITVAVRQSQGLDGSVSNAMTLISVLTATWLASIAWSTSLTGWTPPGKSERKTFFGGEGGGVI